MIFELIRCFYPQPVNAGILAAAIPYKQELTVATALSCGLSSILMGMWSNLPFAVGPAVGLNAFFAYSVVLGLGLPWQTALSAVAGSGIAVGVLSLSGARAFLMRLLPSCIRISLACGIGIFMSYIGLQSVGIIVANEFTLTQLNGFTSSNPDFFKIWAGIACTFLTAVLMTLRFPGAVLAGIACESTAKAPLHQRVFRL